MNTLFSFSDIHKSHGNLHVLNGISADISNGEIVSIIGPSGCGKSTLLKILAGIDSPDSGQINGFGLTKEDNNISYMPQKDSLMPWLTVQENLELEFKLGKHKNADKKKMSAYLKEFGLTEYKTYFPHQISGGMYKKVLTIRSVLRDSKILLLDEPFSSLDSITRRKMQVWLKSFLLKVESSVILVTHDIKEALILSNKIIVLSQSPAEILHVLSVESTAAKYLYEQEKVLESLLINE